MTAKDDKDERTMTLAGYWRSELDPERVMHARVTHWQEEEQQQREDALTVEEPFEIRVDGQSLAVIMRTPGHDRELAAGFLLSEGVIGRPEEIITLAEAVDEDGLPLPNVLNVTLRPRGLPGQGGAFQAQPTTFERHFAVSASCGLCGKNSIADLMLAVPPLPPDTLRIPASVLYTLSSRLRNEQAIFTHTGGLHAAALFRPDGKMLLLREDIGRHNAVDKLIGYGALHARFPFQEHILMVSGRTSFEIIQKALLARIPCIAAISAPSSLAVELADTGGITLIGFLRDHAMNVYTHPQRIV